MLYKTHSRIGKSAGLTTILVGQLVGRLPSDVFTNMKLLPNLVASAAIIYMFSLIGSSIPDLDQVSSGPTNMNLLTKLVNRVLIAMGAKHRSKLTHSMDSILIISAGFYIAIRILFSKIALQIQGLTHNPGVATYAIYFGVCVLVYLFMHKIKCDVRQIAMVEAAVISAMFCTLSADTVVLMVGISFLSGAWSHIIADMFTEGGAYVTVLQKKPIRLVPARLSFLGFKPFKHGFSSGSSWEMFVFGLASVYNAVLVGVIILVSIRSDILRLIMSRP